jgi:hypothetical protein
VRRAASEAWFLVGILLRVAAAAALVWVAFIAISHGGVWYLLLIPTIPLALFDLVFASVLLGSRAKELRSARGHS